MRPYRKAPRMRSLLCLRGKYNMGESIKSFKTIQEQINILKSRHLLIPDEERAKIYLARYGYYAIINGYKDFFMVDPRDDSKGFKPNTTFDHIYDLFKMDRQLRHGIANALEIFEENFSEAISYTIAENISVNSDDYLLRQKYNSGRSYQWRGNTRWPIDDTLRMWKRNINSESQPMKHYRDRYGNVPPWISIKEFTFGSLVWLFQLLKKKEKTAVIARITGIDPLIIEGQIKNDSLKPMFHELLKLYLAYRNATAHNNRIYNFQSKKHKLSYNNFLHQKMKVSPAEYRLKKGQNRVGVLLKSAELFDNVDFRVELEVRIIFPIVRYLEIYPNDKIYLLGQLELNEQWYELQSSHFRK